MPDTQQIFKLRKDGKLEEALAQSRQLFAEKPLDSWLIRAYGWTLHDTLKTTKGPNADEIVRGLFAEFEALQIPKEEGRLTDAREFWRAKIPRADGVASLGAILESAKNASDAGNRRDALAKFREALQAYRDVRQASMALGWEIQRFLKDILAQEPSDGTAASKGVERQKGSYWDNRHSV
jgi:tetratricopeptide (TPR) repeat protein